MIEFEDILSAAQSQLALAFPRRPNVENLQVKDFDRPSFYFRWTASQVSDASRAALRVQRTLEIICFEALRDVNSQQSDLRALLDTQQMVFRLFSAGYLTVGDRALHMTAKLGEVDSDAATVELAFDYLDARPETQQDYDRMRQVHLNLPGLLLQQKNHCIILALCLCPGALHILTHIPRNMIKMFHAQLVQSVKTGKSQSRLIRHIYPGDHIVCCFLFRAFKVLSGSVQSQHNNYRKEKQQNRDYNSGSFVLFGPELILECKRKYFFHIFQNLFHAIYPRLSQSCFWQDRSYLSISACFLYI